MTPVTSHHDSNTVCVTICSRNNCYIHLPRLLVLRITQWQRNQRSRGHKCHNQIMVMHRRNKSRVFKSFNTSHSLLYTSFVFNAISSKIRTQSFSQPILYVPGFNCYWCECWIQGRYCSSARFSGQFAEMVERNILLQFVCHFALIEVGHLPCLWTS